MDNYDIEEVLEYAEDLKRELKSKDDIEAFNQAVMRLSDVVQKLNCIDSFEDIRD
jgi:cell fate (sporulation/competence/biofilm development) regulator YlbF (YheA/YmcA/DUF963 family)